MTRRICLAFVLAGCVERQTNIDGEDEDVEHPSCMILPARGYFEDDSTHFMVNEWGTTATVCMCMTKQELLDKVYVDELNERGLVECQRISTLYYDFAWNTCQESYEQGTWLNGVFPATGDEAWMNPLGLTCGDDEFDAGGCSIPPRETLRTPWAPRTPWALLLVAGLFFVGRRLRGATSWPTREV